MNKPTYEELQAQVERLRDTANRLSFWLVHDEPEWNPSTATSSAFSELQDAISETTTQSLAALKAQWQAEALEQCVTLCKCKVWDGPNIYSEAVLEFARELRQNTGANK